MQIKDTKNFNIDNYVEPDLVKDLIEMEVDNSIKFYAEKDHRGMYKLHIEGYYTNDFLESIKDHKPALLRATRLRRFRKHIIEGQDWLDDLGEIVLVEGDYTDETIESYFETLADWESMEYKRYFIHNDKYCIRNHTQDKKCNQTLFPCRHCAIAEKNSYPRISTRSNLIRTY